MAIRRNIAPSMPELLERERLLRQEALKGAKARPLPEPEYEEEFEAPKMTLADAVVDPLTTELISINLLSGTLLTSAGEFPLSALETAQAAYVARESLTRNLNTLIQALGQKYGIPKLEEQLAAQAQAAATALQKQAEAAATAAPPSAKLEVVPKSSATVVEEEIDEDNDLPPTPTNKHRPKASA